MDPSSANVDQGRRRLIGAAGSALLFTEVGSINAAAAQLAAEGIAAHEPGSSPSFTQIKQVNAGVLNVGYAEAGPADGPVAVLLHGWPYDVHSFAEVAPILANAGYRVLVPYLRGYGTTRFLSD